jgi:hypothetical protein
MGPWSRGWAPLRGRAGSKAHPNLPTSRGQGFVRPHELRGNPCAPGCEYQPQNPTLGPMGKPFEAGFAASNQSDHAMNNQPASKYIFSEGSPPAFCHTDYGGPFSRSTAAAHRARIAAETSYFTPSTTRAECFRGSPRRIAKPYGRGSRAEGPSGGQPNGIMPQELTE